MAATAVDDNGRTEQLKIVLIVDDEALFRFAVATNLRAANFIVLVASSAKEALEIAHIRPIDALITDLQLGGYMDGIDLVTAVRALRPATAILVTSADADKVRAARELAPGVDFITKPCGPAEIRARVERLLARPADHRSLPPEK